MNRLKYSILVFLGACCYGTLSTIVKLGIAEGYSIQQILGGQYLFGWSFMLFLMLLFSRVRLGWKQAGSLVLAGIPLSLTSICYGYAVEQLPASLAVLLSYRQLSRCRYWCCTRRSPRCNGSASPLFSSGLRSRSFS